MSHDQNLDIRKYVDILLRYIWVIIIPTLSLTIIAYVSSRAIHNRYTSQTLVVLDQKKVSENLVKPAVTGEINDALVNLSEQILSRTRLESIINHFGPVDSEHGRVDKDVLVEHLREMIAVTPLKGGTQGAQGGASGFHISVTASRPELARQICNQLISMFMEENIRAREQRANGTTEFLKKELAEAKAKLNEQEAQLSEFRKRYVGQLPGEEQTNLGMLATLNNNLQTVTQEASRSQQDRNYTASLLQQELTTWRASGGGDAQSLEEQLVKAQAQLVVFEGLYTTDHPDVIRTKYQIEELKSKLREASHAPPTPDSAGSEITEPAQIRQWRVQLQHLDEVINDKAAEQEHIQKEIQNYQARLHLSPTIAEQLKTLNQDYQSALIMYNDLVSKMSQSEIAARLELQQQNEQFRVVDPPSLPQKPSYPKRWMFALGGLGVGLLLGLCLALLLEELDKSIRTEHDVHYYLNLRALATVPVTAIGTENSN
jgi:polysaccharide chain length determinant protein (PEP-CTERM system associated)